MLTPPPWTQWSQADEIPCRFTQAECQMNSAFLLHLLGREWVEKACIPFSRHPLGAEWATNGSCAFLELNRLADDARLIRRVPGFDGLIGDLRDGQRCRAAWHVIRAAASFARGGTPVLEFFAQGQAKIPDFAVGTLSRKINVEAKVLMSSDREEQFSAFATPLLDAIFKDALAAEAVHPPVTVVFRDSDSLPPAEAVLSTISDLLTEGAATVRRTARAELFSVFVDPPPATTGLYQLCYLLCPRSEKENLRVQSRAREASHQLLSDMAQRRPGIMWLGLTQHQDAGFLHKLMNRRFNAGQYPGISGMVLSLSGTHLEPPRRTVVDYLLTFKKPRAKFTLPTPVPLKSPDLCGPLLALQASLSGISAYRVAKSGVRISQEVRGVALPDIRRIDPTWLPV